MTDYEHNKSCVEITTLVMRKTVESVVDEDEGLDTSLVINFTDGMKLRIRYDYIYEWEVVTK